MKTDSTAKTAANQECDNMEALKKLNFDNRDFKTALQENNLTLYVLLQNVLDIILCWMKRVDLYS